MRFFILFTLSLAHLSAAYAQVGCTLTLSGQVTDSSRDGLAGASVRLIGTEHVETTDQNGNYFISGICAGSYELEVRFLGYAKQVVSIELERDSRYNFRLQVEKQVLSEVVVQEQFDHVETTQSIATLSGKALQNAQGKTL
jgi:iron complex outermembrane receptor protein